MQSHAQSTHLRCAVLIVVLLNTAFFVFSVRGVTPQVSAQDTGTWQTLNPSNSPIARHETSFVYAGGKFYLIGGRESQKVQIFNPGTNSWSDGATAPITMHHIQPVTVDGLIYAVAAYSGICCDREFGVSHVYIYDPVQDKWFQTTQIPSNRRRGSVGVVYYQGKFYVVGGLSGGHGSPANSYNYFDVHNPSTGSWQTLPDAPRDRDHFGAAVVNGKLYALGGRASVGSSFFNNTVGEVDVFNFATNTWSTLPGSSNIPTERAGTAVAVLNGEILVIGGEGFGSAYTKTEAFKPTTGTWRTLASMNQARHGTTAAVCNNVVYIAAGSPTQGGGKSNTLERYFQQTAANCPASAITPGQLNASGNTAFGQVTVGSSVTRTLTISNTGGNQGLIVRNVTKSGSADFSFTDNVSFPIVVAPGAALTLQVTYAPGGAGQDTGSLSVIYERPGSPLQIALSGEGITGSSPTDTPAPATPTTIPPPVTRTPTAEFPTDFPTATVTIPTTPQAALNLVQNGGFEFADPLDAKQAQFWKVRDGSNARRKMNRVGHPTKPDKVIAFKGTAAYKLKAKAGFESRIVQKIKPVQVSPQAGQSLVLDLWAKVKKLNTIDNQGRVKVKFAYDNDSKDAFNLDLTNTADFAYLLFTQSSPLLPSQLTKLKVIIQIRGSGSLYVDEARLRVCGGAYLCS
jgi:hypothetical protein